MSLSLAVVCEAPADQRTGCDLADRVFMAEVAWIEQQMLPHYRQWRGLSPPEPHLLWRDVRDLARSRRIRAHGHFSGEPGAPDAHNARRVLLLLHSAAQPPHAVVLLRDDDGQTQRRRGLEQARDSSNIGIPVVIGLAQPKRECWVIAGFEPQNDEENRRLETLVSQLKFDPREAAQRLTAGRPANAPRNAKRVLRQLTEGDPERESACWRNTDLRLLAARGRNTGLSEYLGEVRERLVPLFTASPDP